MVAVDALGGAPFKGKVDSIGAATGATSACCRPTTPAATIVKVVQRVPVKIVFEGGQDLSQLRPGLSVVPTVYTR